MERVLYVSKRTRTPLSRTTSLHSGGTAVNIIMTIIKKDNKYKQLQLCIEKYTYREMKSVGDRMLTKHKD